MTNFKFQMRTKKNWILDIGYWILPGCRQSKDIPCICEEGFTLIELLIVVAIIGILSALLMTNFIGIRQRARDAERKSDIRQMQSALELYRSDVGSYPSAGGTNMLNSTACPTPAAFAANGTTYMQQIPCDPLASGGYYNSGSYYYTSNGSTYTLAACLENTADTDVSSSFSGDSSCTSGKYYVKNNP